MEYKERVAKKLMHSDIIDYLLSHSLEKNEAIIPNLLICICEVQKAKKWN